MGLGEDIVNLAFGLLFGAVAVAFALAFGLGGRDVAARQLETWRGRLKDMGDRGGSVPTTGGPASSGPVSGSGFETGVSSHASGGETLLRRGGEGDGILPPQESGGDIPTTGFAADQGMEDTHSGGIVPPFRPDYDEGEDNLSDRKF